MTSSDLSETQLREAVLVGSWMAQMEGRSMLQRRMVARMKAREAETARVTKGLAATPPVSLT